MNLVGHSVPRNDQNSFHRMFGIIMHVADDVTPHELTLKRAGDGRVYLGFAGPAGDAQDREILTMGEKMFVARYLDPDANTRYGTLIYVRCAKG